MSEIVGTVDFADRNAEKALCEHYGSYSLCRSICDGQKGYSVKYPDGMSIFHFRLDSALRTILRGLGHAEDRDIIVIGEPETGNAWMVRK